MTVSIEVGRIGHEENSEYAKYKRLLLSVAKCFRHKSDPRLNAI